MARVYLDSSIVGQDWFKKVLPELEACPNVKFMCSFHGKAGEELEKTRSLANFLQVMSRMKRVRKVTSEEYAARVSEVLSAPSWQSTAACDDEHIFSVVRVCGSCFVFSTDSRLASCRSVMRQELSKEFSEFIIVSKQDVYDAKKPLILK